MDTSYGITQVFDTCLSWFGLIYSSGISLFNWFATPIGPSGDQYLDVVLESFYGYTPFELAFGVALSSVLLFAFVKFMMGFILS